MYQLYEYIKYMLPCLISWFLSQAVKMIICSIKKEQKNMFASGGMPSAHTAVVLALVVRLFFTEGFGSPAFAVAFIYMFETNPSTFCRKSSRSVCSEDTTIKPSSRSQTTSNPNPLKNSTSVVGSISSKKGTPPAMVGKF
ncbi:MAG: divergent PAP2 family protein [Clostridiales bacterium]|nr:divergent PAP2 family protein [Clostridiales bacterium]